VQYGLKALRDGAITAEQFVQLKRGDRKLQQRPGLVRRRCNQPVVPAARRIAQVDVIPTIFKSGLLTDAKAVGAGRHHRPEAGAGRGYSHDLANLPGARRLDAANGGHGKQRHPCKQRPDGAALVDQAFGMMDRWLTAEEVDASPIPLPQKVVVNRPADVKDGCFATGGNTPADLAVELSLDDPSCPLKPTLSPRRVAGGPLEENVFKCQLKAANPADPDYGRRGVLRGAVVAPVGSVLERRLRLVQARGRTVQRQRPDIHCWARWRCAAPGAGGAVIMSKARIGFRRLADVDQRQHAATGATIAPSTTAPEHADRPPWAPRCRRAAR
jgi:hypothetical protein